MQTSASAPVAIGSQQSAQSAAPKPKLLDQVRQAIRARHYSKATEKNYVDWSTHFPFSICDLPFAIRGDLLTRWLVD